VPLPMKRTRWSRCTLSDKKSRSLACGTAVPCAIRLFFFLISLALIQSWPAAVCGQDQPPTAVKEISIDQLPNEARTTLRLIKQGGPFPYQRDGAVFGNFERRLPVKKRGYYREYTVPTLGRSDRGARRIVTGENGECYYTEDHYRTFRKIRKGLSG
jgi:ribonuclease T1